VKEGLSLYSSNVRSDKVVAIGSNGTKQEVVISQGHSIDSSNERASESSTVAGLGLLEHIYIICVHMYMYSLRSSYVLLRTLLARE
jgi:hypothetical protein